MPTIPVRSRRSLMVLAAVTFGLFWTVVSGGAVRALAPDGIAGLPYSRSLLASISDVAVLVVLLVLLARIGVSRVLEVAGLRKPPARPMAHLIALFGVAAVVCNFTAPVSDSVRLVDLAWLGFGSPFFEEITYRSLVIGSMMRFAGWRFVPAALLSSVVFGVSHAWQRQGVLDTAGVMAVTAAGSMLFGWMYVRWRFNIWPAVVAHVGLNLIWEVFSLGESALGGWYGNAVRLSLVALIIASTWRLSPAGEPQPAPARARGHHRALR